MRQYRDKFTPKPRPSGFTGNDRPLPSRPARPAPPPRPNPPAGAAAFEPKQPAEDKQRRRMLKATAWRLSKIVQSAPAALRAMDLSALEDLIEQKCPANKPSEESQRGEAMRLAAKLERLRQ